MKIDISTATLKAFMGETGCTSEHIKSKLEYVYRDDRKVELRIDALKSSDLSKLHGFLQSLAKSDSSVLGGVRKITTYLNLKANPKAAHVGSLESLATALKEYISPSLHKWLFKEAQDGYVLPYFVSGIQYYPGRPEHPAYVQMSMCAILRGDKSDGSVTWHTNEISGKKQTVVELLESKGYFLETDEVVARYCEEMAKYKEIHEDIGGQYNATGTAMSSARSWRCTSDVAMERDGEPTKVVMDDGTGDNDNEDARGARGGGERMVSSLFWTGKRDVDGEVSEGDDSVAVPVHPYVMVFDLMKHCHVVIHVSNLEPYQYDEDMATKLVLPEETKDLIRILVQGSQDHLDDIVKGKTGGTIVIATGPPGTGKTLTAEVFSEAVKRPLYVVQCSQLGTDEESLEKHLARVLARSTRWKAILLIDEADVYVHERGTDIQQNAIVGVFLRVLEYYQGILFMTSNRATIIDDAIMSRATAWIKYENPDADDQLRIWRILSKQFKIPLGDKELLEIVEHFSGISGRNIKNLLKLGYRLASARNTPVDFNVLSYVEQFLDLGRDRA
jgi:hypothetical protein